MHADRNLRAADATSRRDRRRPAVRLLVSAPLVVLADSRSRILRHDIRYPLRAVDVGVFVDALAAVFNVQISSVVVSIHGRVRAVRMFGSHLTISGGMHNALLEAERLGFDSVQVFTKNCSFTSGRAADRRLK
jgi:hypothetical protein